MNTILPELQLVGLIYTLAKDGLGYVWKAIGHNLGMYWN